MWHTVVATILTFSSLTAGSHLSSHHAHKRNLHTRNIVTDGSISDSYDYVIVGGGLAGLVLASRLSEDANTTVLVLEAGETGDAVATQINTPADTYYNSLTKTEYDWAFRTAPQAALNGNNASWPRGKVLGGSSAINGMYLVRPNEPEINAWEAIIASDDKTAASSWGWDSFYAAMKKSETFDAPSSDIAQTAGIQYNAASHGSSGPIHWGYTGYTFPVIGNWTPTMNTLGVDTNTDPTGGSNSGAYVACSSINSANWTRSYSRSGYIDSLPPRSNLDILAGATVTNIVWSNSSSTNLTATGVQYAASATDAKKTVNVNREVILAGGTVGSPQVLMLSGVGPSDVLSAAGVDVKLNLPGVGQHLQDHISAGLVFTTSAETAGAVHAAGGDLANSAEFLSYINSATAYVNMTTLLGSNATSFISDAKSNIDSAASTIVPSTDSTVLAGYKAVYDVVTDTIYTGASGQTEILMAITGDGVIIIQAALQHPLSQGRLYITSPSAFDAPTIDPQYLAHEADLVILREGLKMARKVSQTEPLSTYITGETTPGSSVSTDEDWEAWLRNSVGTEYHPTGTCSMLPQSLGGVVDANLKVYGTANVRVADASVYPFELSSHLGAPTYGLAEQASTIMRNFYNGVSTTSTNSSSTTNSSSSAGSSSSNNTTKNGAVAAGSSLSAVVGALGVSVVCAGLALVAF